MWPCPNRSTQLVSLQRILLVYWILSALSEAPARAADLRPETVAAFERYVRAMENRMDDDIRENQFLIVDRLPARDRHSAYGQLQRGQVYLQELHAREDDRTIQVPFGLIHHWAGVIFVPKASTSEVFAVLEDYDNHQNIYKPDIRRSRRIERNGNESKIYLQLYNKSLVTVVLNADFNVVETRIGNTRGQIASR